MADKQDKAESEKRKAEALRANLRRRKEAGRADKPPSKTRRPQDAG